MDLNQFTISDVEDFREAFRRIDSNKKGFLVVVDGENKALGTLTDGDIRRCLIKGTALNEQIKGRFNHELRVR